MLRRDQALALFMEGAFEEGTGKMGLGTLRYSPNPVTCIVDKFHAGEDSVELTGIPRPVPIVASIGEARKLGAEVLVLGIAPPGGLIPEIWNPTIEESVALGFSIINGLHDLLAPRFTRLAPGQWIWDLRIEPKGISPSTGAAMGLTNRRLLMIGTDMAIGKMTAGLEIYAAALAKGVRAEFVATGQIGITITGRGIPLDAIRVDFAAGAVEREVMNAKDAELVVIEGQGSLIHPGSSANLPLLRGSMPTHLVICHRAGMTHLNRVPAVTIPPLRELAGLYEELASAFGNFPRPKTVGVCLNTSELSEPQARQSLDESESISGFVTVDPVRFGVDRLMRVLID